MVFQEASRLPWTNSALTTARMHQAAASSIAAARTATPPKSVCIILRSWSTRASIGKAVRRARPPRRA